MELQDINVGMTVKIKSKEDIDKINAKYDNVFVPPMYQYCGTEIKISQEYFDQLSSYDYPSFQHKFDKNSTWWIYPYMLDEIKQYIYALSIFDEWGNEQVCQLFSSLEKCDKHMENWNQIYQTTFVDKIELDSNIRTDRYVYSIETVPAKKIVTRKKV